MKDLFTALALIALATTGCTQNGGNVRPMAIASQPWEPAQASLKTAQNDIAKGGLRALQPRVTELENALAGAGSSYAAAPASGESGYVLTDGPMESLAALAAVANGAHSAGKKVTAVDSPYPGIAFVLGVYYNEVDRPVDALHALDSGLALPSATPDASLGQHRPLLICERGAALAKLKRWPESLAAYESGLASPTLSDKNRARMLRGRGMALTELGRLDEAERSYQDSLKAEPGNPLALNELGYISHLRSGRSAAAPNLFIPRQP